MRKFAIGIFAVFATITLSSCDPWEDDSYHEGTTSGEEVEITGNWKLISIKMGDGFDFNGDGTISNDLMVETNCYQNELMTFNEDLTGISTSNSYADVIVNGTTYITECVPEIEETPFTWTQNQNNISITIDTQVIPAILAGNTLTFVIPEGFEASDGQPGGYTITQDITMTYQKLP